MKPQEKAVILFYSFYNTKDMNITWEQAKQCALICCDEVIENIEDHTGENIAYWNEVKNEINKL
jgi:hypothetical protein